MPWQKKGDNIDENFEIVLQTCENLFRRGSIARRVSFFGTICLVGHIAFEL